MTIFLSRLSTFFFSLLSLFILEIDLLEVSLDEPVLVHRFDDGDEHGGRVGAVRVVDAQGRG